MIETPNIQDCIESVNNLIVANKTETSLKIISCNEISAMIGNNKDSDFKKEIIWTLQPRMLEETDANDTDSPMFRYLIYGILIIWLLGFVYFIYNWIKCVMSRPKDLEDSSDEDEEYNKGNEKRMEMKNVLP